MRDAKLSSLAAVRAGWRLSAGFCVFVVSAAAVACRGGAISGLLSGDLTKTHALDDGLSPAAGSGNILQPHNSDGNQIGGDPTPAALTAFGQGLYRGQDPRLNQVNGFYYTVGQNDTGQNLSLWKHRSLLNKGVGKNIQAILPGALCSPVYIDKLGGQSIDAWFMFSPTDFYHNAGADPYDNADQWARAGSMPWTDLGQIQSVPFDFDVFQNPQDGPYKGRWYLFYVRNDASVSFAENIHITEIIAIGAGGISLSNTAATADNKIISFRTASWTDAIVEAPGVAIHGQSVTLAYAGNGAPTSLYAVGLAALQPGNDPLSPASWVNIGGGQCDSVPAGPSFATTDSVWGPGVARFVHSADGTEDWMMYHSKVFDTFLPGGPPEPQQTQQERWTRQINIAKIGWRKLQCGGQTLTVPDLGTPAAPGTRMAVPSGDIGPQPPTQRLRFEAEEMIPFGFVMGPAIQQARTNSDTQSITALCSGCSGGEKITNLDLLAQNQPTSPKRSGLTLRNVPAAGGLGIGYAAASPGALDIYVQGKQAATVALAATGSLDTMGSVDTKLTIAAGSELSLVFEVGRSQPVDVDYIELLPP